MLFSNQFYKNGSITLTIVSFMTYVIANSVPIWSELTGEFSSRTLGLWEVCRTNMNIRICEKFPCSSELAGTNICSKIKVAQAFVTLACLFSGFCIITLLGFLKINGNLKRLLLLATKCIGVFIFIFGTIGVAVGVQSTMHPFDKVVYAMAIGAILGIIAIPISFANAIFLLLLNE